MLKSGSKCKIEEHLTDFDGETTKFNNKTYPLIFSGIEFIFSLHINPDNEEIKGFVLRI